METKTKKKTLEELTILTKPLFEHPKKMELIEIAKSMKTTSSTNKAAMRATAGDIPASRACRWLMTAINTYGDEGLAHILKNDEYGQILWLESLPKDELTESELQILGNHYANLAEVFKAPNEALANERFNALDKQIEEEESQTMKKKLRIFKRFCVVMNIHPLEAKNIYDEYWDFCLSEDIPYENRMRAEEFHAEYQYIVDEE